MSEIREESSSQEIKELLLKNQELLKDNNVLLHKMHRSAMWATAFRVVWFAIIIGVPVGIYYFVLEPNVANMRDAIDVMIQGAKDVSGMRSILDGVPSRQ